MIMKSLIILGILLTILPILAILGEIKKLMLDRESVYITQKHKEQHVALLGLILVMLMGSLSFSMKYVNDLSDIIFNILFLSVFSAYALAHLRCERLGKETLSMNFTTITKIFINSIKDLFN